MFCQLSGEVPVEPVVTKSGHLYEKRLIIKYIAENGKDPISGDALTADDLIPLQNQKVVRPRPPTATSIPGLLSILQNEWDAIVLESFQLRDAHHKMREELTTALYENDAAKRVIARLIREREEAQEALKNIKANMGGMAGTDANGTDNEMEVDEQGQGSTSEPLPDDIVAKMDARQQELFGDRRKRKHPNLATPDELTNLSSKSKYKGSIAGAIKVLSVSKHQPQHVVIGSASGSITISNTEKEEIIASHKDGKQIKAVSFHDLGHNPRPDVVFAASVDHTVKAFEIETSRRGTSKLKNLWTMNNHKDVVTSFSLQATGDYYVSASMDGSWIFGDVESGRAISTVALDDQSGIASAVLHPDGLLLATGTDNGVIRIWDVKSRSAAAQFDNQGSVSQLVFSENGYHLASVALGESESVVNVWHLKKLESAKTFTLRSTGVFAAFDYSGSYLGIAENNVIKVYGVKSWNEIAEFTLPSDQSITSFAWGADAKNLVVAGGDQLYLF